MGDLGEILYLTRNVNSLIGFLLELAKKPIVLEEKSPVPPSINLWLQEAGAHVWMGRLAARKAAGKKSK